MEARFHLEFTKRWVSLFFLFFIVINDLLNSVVRVLLSYGGSHWFKSNSRYISLCRYISLHSKFIVGITYRTYSILDTLDIRYPVSNPFFFTDFLFFFRCILSIRLDRLDLIGFRKLAKQIANPMYQSNQSKKELL